MRSVKWLAAALLAGACTSPGPAVAPSPSASPVTHLIRVVTAGADGPVGGLEVCAVAFSGARTCGPTGPDGTVALRVAPGVYQVRAQTPQSQRPVGELTAADAVAGDAGVRLQFERIRRITGALRDEAVLPLAGAQACAKPLTLGPEVCGRTRADGGYTLEVTPGFYKLRLDGAPSRKLLSQWAYGRLDTGEAEVFDLRGADATIDEVVLVEGVVLSGTIRGSDGHPLKAAQVCTHTLAAPLGWDCERADEHGHYVALRERGRYYVWVIPPDDEPYLMQWWYGGFTGVDAATVVLDADDTLDMTLRLGPSIRGQVTGPDGSPVLGALVCVDTPFPTGRICRPTDASGTYRVTTRPETYTVQVLPPAGSDLIGTYWGGGRTWLDARTVSVGTRDVTVDVALRRGVRVTGVVRSAAGVPLEGASINLSDAGGIVAAVYTDDTGAYAAAVPRGTYRMDVFAPFPSQVVSDEGRTVTIDGPRAIDVALTDALP